MYSTVLWPYSPAILQNIYYIYIYRVYTEVFYHRLTLLTGCPYFLYTNMKKTIKECLVSITKLAL